jgi:biotin transport system substrate-specific component
MKRRTLLPLVQTALFAACLAVLTPVALPIGPVPITPGTLVVLFAALTLGGARGSLAVLVYLLLGGVGLPVFSGYAGGAAVLLGPTGGFLLGYLPLAAIAGFFARRLGGRIGIAVGGALGMLILYLLGSLRYGSLAGVGIGAALSVCVLPFLPFDLLKLGIATVAAPYLSRLSRRYF